MDEERKSCEEELVKLRGEIEEIGKGKCGCSCCEAEKILSGEAEDCREVGDLVEIRLREGMKKAKRQLEEREKRVQEEYERYRGENEGGRERRGFII